MFVDEKPRIEKSRAVVRDQERDYRCLQKRWEQAKEPSVNLPLTAFKQDIFLSFLVRKLYEGKKLYEIEDVEASQKTGRAPTQGWWVSELVKDEPSTSLRALAAMVFARAHDFQPARLEALKLYGEALRRVGELIEDQKLAREFNTLTSITTLCMYEVSSVLRLTRKDLLMS